MEKTDMRISTERVQLYPSKPWTEADVEILRERWGNRPTAFIALELGRTPQSVRSKAAAEGINKTDKIMRLKLGNRRWSDWDDQELKRMVKRKGITLQRVAMTLGRSEAAILERMRAMRLYLEEPRRARQSWPEEMVSLVCQGIIDGDSVRTLAIKTRRPEMSVRNLLMKKFQTSSIAILREKLSEEPETWKQVAR